MRYTTNGTNPTSTTGTLINGTRGESSGSRLNFLTFLHGLTTAPDNTEAASLITRNVKTFRRDPDAPSTHTVNPYVISPGGAIRCEHLGAQFDSEPTDVLEFYITIERKLKSDAVQTIRSNSIVMYRPKEESVSPGEKIDKPAPASSPKAAITPEGKG